MLPTDGSGCASNPRATSHSQRPVASSPTTPPPPSRALEPVDLYASLVPEYENVHRGQSQSSRTTTERFEASYDTIAAWLNAPSRRTIALYRNTTEAHNAAMYTMMTEVRDGDNVVTTLLEHNSNYVPWYALCREPCPARHPGGVPAGPVGPRDRSTRPGTSGRAGRLPNKIVWCTEHRTSWGLNHP